MFLSCLIDADPNRPGMHMKLIKFLLKLKAPRIVYVSCNPATCARDVDYLCHGVVCIVILVPFLPLVRVLLDSIIWVVEKICAARAGYRRMLQNDKSTASRYVSSHSSYWVCLSTGALLILTAKNCSRIGTISHSLLHLGLIWMFKSLWLYYYLKHWWTLEKMKHLLKKKMVEIVWSGLDIFEKRPLNALVKRVWIRPKKRRGFD